MDALDNEDYGDNDNNDDESNDDDSSLLIHVPLLQSTAEVPSKILDKPPEGFEWDDDAILECFELALKSHDQNIKKNNNNIDDSSDNNHKDDPTDFAWYPPTQNPNDNFIPSIWQPKSLPLPIWANDPFAELLVEKQNESIPK